MRNLYPVIFVSGPAIVQQHILVFETFRVIQH